MGNSYVPALTAGSVISGLSAGILILLAQVYGSVETEQVQSSTGSVQTLMFRVVGGLACLFHRQARWPGVENHLESGDVRVNMRVEHNGVTGRKAGNFRPVFLLPICFLEAENISHHCKYIRRHYYGLTG